MAIENKAHTLEALLEQVQEHRRSQVDYIAPTGELQVVTEIKEGGNETNVILEATGGAPTQILTANAVAFDQMASKAGIDIRTAKRFQQQYPYVLDHALNAIHLQEPRNAMLRTFDRGNNSGVLRAVVSDKFKTFDHGDVLESVLPPLIESDAQWQIVNAAITDKRLYARFKSLVITGQGKAIGDRMAQGVVISNSETGHGSVSVAQLIWTLVCLNGMQTQNKSATAHLTSSRSDGDTWALLTDESKRLDNAALSSKLTDVTAAYSSREMFETVLEQFRHAAGDLVTNGMAAAQPAVEALGKVLQLSRAETSSVLDGLMQTIQQDGYRGEPLSRATLVNAVTAVANTSDADSVSDWQSRGGRVLDLPANQWSSIASVPVAMAA